MLLVRCRDGRQLIRHRPGGRRADAAQRSPPVSEAFHAGYSPDTTALHDVLSRLGAPVLLLAGGRDPWPTAAAAARAAALLPDARPTIQPYAGHHLGLVGPQAFHPGRRGLPRVRTGSGTRRWRHTACAGGVLA
ncbi:hypothetical protein AB0I68_25820 [Streptomyces sp. NPDC050448]|uniref:alpha/beta fold hydrolase n=1 Tax=Streptomyces sp. NPDC050448 TaxID=3155404 RepID=UPI003436DE5F